VTVVVDDTLGRAEHGVERTEDEEARRRRRRRGRRGGRRGGREDGDRPADAFVWIRPRVPFGDSAFAWHDPASLIRDTEIEEILPQGRRADPQASGPRPEAVQILLVGEQGPERLRAPGTMGLYTGLILETENPNQLQGVIAHEVGHLAGGHGVPFRRHERGRHEAVPPDHGPGRPGRPGGRARRSRGCWPATPAISAPWAPWATAANRKAAPTRPGATLLDATGQSPARAWPSSSTTSATRRSSTSRRYAYFRSHPLSSDRIDALRNRVERLPHYNKSTRPTALAEHEIMKAKLDGFMNPQQAMIKYKETDKSYPARYARAIAYYQMKEPDKALKLIDALLAEQPEQSLPVGAEGPDPVRVRPRQGAEAPQRKLGELKPDAPCCGSTSARP
jgi:predicted Zn-dependent protease